MSVSTVQDVGRPLITIAITCYNAEDTIQRAVESALNQTWRRREIVIVDDGSTDGSRTILRKLERTHPELRVIAHEENSGFPSALNTVLSEARGVFVAFLDDDDASVPSRVVRQYQRIVEYEAKHPGATILCYSNRDVVEAGNLNPSMRLLGIGRVPVEPFGPQVADYVLGLSRGDGRHCWGRFGSCTLMARTQALRDLGSFDARFRRCAELDFAVRAALAGSHFISVDAPLVTQYLTPTADKAGEVRLRYRLLLVEKHRDYLKQKRSYAGAWCYVHARFHRSRHGRWRLWYLAALIVFPWRVSLRRIRGSSMLARLRPVPDGPRRPDRQHRLVR